MMDAITYHGLDRKWKKNEQHSAYFWWWLKQCIKNISRLSIHNGDFISSQTKTMSGKFSVLSVNIQSLNSKFDGLMAILSCLEKYDLHFSAVCLQETWLTDSHDVSIFSMPGYRLINAGKSCSECGGLLIYVHDWFSYSIQNITRNSKLWEGCLLKCTVVQWETKLW